MIKIFRHIRQSLIMENKKGKYLKYAIGEIILVVIGILIALQINNWNETHKNKKEAHFQLSKLKDNLNSDKAQLKTAISKDSVYISNLVHCVSVLSNETNATKEAFMIRFQDMSTTNNFRPTIGTFESLISSGKIELINNQELLDALFSYYNANNYSAWDSAVKDYSRNIFAPYLLNFDNVPNITDEKEGLGFTQFDVSKFSVKGKTLEDYKQNQFILNALRIKIQLFEGQNMQYIAMIKDIDSLINKIKIELKPI